MSFFSSQLAVGRQDDTGDTGDAQTNILKNIVEDLKRGVMSVKTKSWHISQYIICI